MHFLHTKLWKNNIINDQPAKLNLKFVICEKIHPRKQYVENCIKRMEISLNNWGTTYILFKSPNAFAV